MVITAKHQSTDFYISKISKYRRMEKLAKNLGGKWGDPVGCRFKSKANEPFGCP